jgi:NAD+ kinase
MSRATGLIMTLAFLADSRPKAQAACAELQVRYGNTPLETATVIVALGGDGFMIDTLHRTAALQKPVYGLNLGTVGFLMNTFSPETLLQDIAKAEHQHIIPLAINATTLDGQIHRYYAINDVSLLRDSPQAANLAIQINEETMIERLICDGVLVATPTGSTAYNASLGGPILPINANVLALSPIAAFRPRRWRGAVLPSNATIHLTVLDPAKRPVMMAADSQGLKNVTHLDVQLSKDQHYTLLFSPGHSLERRILEEQFC